MGLSGSRPLSLSASTVVNAMVEGEDLVWFGLIRMPCRCQSSVNRVATLHWPYVHRTIANQYLCMNRYRYMVGTAGVVHIIHAQLN